MSSSGSAVQRSGGTDRLDRLAAAAAQDLRALAVVVTAVEDGQPPRIVAVAGMTRRRADQMLPSLWAGERVIAGSSLHAGEGTGGLLLDGPVLTVAAEVGGQRVGTVHIVGADSSVADSEPVLRAYAAHLAVGIAASSRHGPPPPPSLAHIDALGDLPLVTRSWNEFIQGLEVTLSDAFGYGTIGLMLWQGDSDTLQMMPGSFGVDRATAASYRVAISNSRSNAARVVATGYPYLSNNARGDAGILQEYVHSLGVERLMSVPLVLGERRVGVLHLANKEGGYALGDLWRLQALIPYLARAILTVEALFRLRRGRRLEGVLSALAVAIASGNSMQNFLPPAIENVTVATDADLVALTIGDAEPIVRRSGPVAEGLEQSVLATASSKPDFCANTSGPHSADDPGTTVMHIPVHLGTQRVGTLSALRRRADPFAGDERDAFTRLAKLAALAWATERYQQQKAEVARVQERNRIADDLHDDVAQILFAAQLPLDTALEVPGIDPAVVGEIEQARGLIEMADEALRSAIHQLSRHEEDRFSSELFLLASEVEHNFGLPIHLEVGDDVEQASARLTRPVRELLLRAAREALVNSAKHAGPCRVMVTVRVSPRGRLTMKVSDDGPGLRVTNDGAGHGIASLRRSIRRHGGTLQIQSGATGGTTLNVSVRV